MMILTAFLCTLVALAQGNSHQRIVGGVEATYGDHPYICSIQIPSDAGWFHVCGCVIWNEDHVVTAAHCLDEAASRYQVVVGNHHIQETDSHQVAHFVSSYVRHPDWEISDPSRAHDIGVMKLNSSITFNSFVNKVTFASSGNFEGQKCLLMGWGQLSGTEGSANVLKKVEIEKIPNFDCGHLVGGGVTDGQMCFFEGYGVGSCFGDSGGPAICGDLMVGITSWGSIDCSGVTPNVYTRVSYYYNWLVSHAGDN